MVQCFLYKTQVGHYNLSDYKSERIFRQVQENLCCVLSRKQLYQHLKQMGNINPKILYN